MGCREKETSREEGQKVPGCQKLPKDRTAKRKIRQRKAVLYKTSEFFDSAMTSEKLSGEKGVSGFGLRCQQEVGRIVKIQTCQGQTRSRERNVKEKSSKSRRNGCDNQAMKFRLGSPIFPPFGPTSITRLGPGLYWYLYSKYPVLTPSSAPAGRHKRSWPGS